MISSTRKLAFEHACRDHLRIGPIPAFDSVACKEVFCRVSSARSHVHCPEKDCTETPKSASAWQSHRFAHYVDDARYCHDPQCPSSGEKHTHCPEAACDHEYLSYRNLVYHHLSQHTRLTRENVSTADTHDPMGRYRCPLKWSSNCAKRFDIYNKAVEHACKVHLDNAEIAPWLESRCVDDSCTTRDVRAHVHCEIPGCRRISFTSRLNWEHHVLTHRANDALPWCCCLGVRHLHCGRERCAFRTPVVNIWKAHLTLHDNGTIAQVGSEQR